MNPSPLQAAGYPANGTSSFRTIHPQSLLTGYSGSKIKASTIRWPILVKEVSQFLDHYAYSKLYLSLVQKSGISVDVINPSNLPTSDIEQTIVVAHSLRMLEEKLNSPPVKSGHQYAGFLQYRGLIHQTGVGKPFYWVKGQSPNIDSEEFLQLLKEFTKKDGKVF